MEQREAPARPAKHRGKGVEGGPSAARERASVGRDRAPNPSDREQRRLFLLLVACSVLVLGVAGSALGGLWWDHYQQAAISASASDTAGAVSAAIGDALRADRNFDAGVEAMVATDPGLTNRQLVAWSSSTDVKARYPGTAGFVFVVPVPAAALPAFIASVEGDPPNGSPATPYFVFPPGQRSQYCLERFGDEYISSGLPIGLDLCALNGSDLSAVLRSGQTEFDTFRVITKAGSIPAAYAKAVLRRYGNLFVMISPTYRAGSSPDTPAERASSFEGWMVGTFSIRALLSSGLGATRHVQVALRYRQGSSPWAPIGMAGSAPGAHLSMTRTIGVGAGLNSRIQAVVTSSVSTDPFLGGFLVGIAGSIFSILLFGFLTYLATSRRRAMQLVERRTEELRHRALHDALTDLPNRALLFDRAERMVLRARREPTVVGALYLDLDDFKEVNDTLGHQSGDALLQAVAARIRTVLRESDTVGRLGGDEFLVLVEASFLEPGPELVAERILAAFAEPFVLETPTRNVLSLHASIGVAIDAGGSVDALIRDADVALYAAKAAGKDRVVVFRPEMQTAADDRRALEAELRRALEEGQLFVRYQPIVDLATMAPKAAEALVRWRHPTRGVLGPDAFIPLAEETGLVVPLGRFVLDRACHQWAEWRAHGHRLAVSVNVSARQLESDRIVNDVRRALERYHLPAGALTLELTETSLMAEPERVTGVLARLKELGVRIALDDFGTGYSSLSYLSKFPIDAMKIDQSFIARLDDAASGPLVHSVIELGRALGIETIAEGIEDRAQLAWLQRERCDSGQGFLFERPLRPEELETWLLEPRHGEGARAAGGMPRAVTA